MQRLYICITSLQLLMNVNIAAVAGARIPIAPPTYGTLTCAQVSALKKDCEAALAKVTLGKPYPCVDVLMFEYNLVKVGTCTIQTYSNRGRAQCLDHDLVIQGGNQILDRCISNAVAYEDYTGGQFEWVTGEGVMFVR